MGIQQQLDLQAKELLCKLLKLLQTEELPSNSEKSCSWLKKAFKLAGISIPILVEEAQISWATAKKISEGEETTIQTRQKCYPVLYKRIAKLTINLLEKPRIPDLGKNPNSILAYIPLYNSKCTTRTCDRLIKEAPEYDENEHKRLIENIVGAVHQLPKIFAKLTGQDVRLKDITAYFGRSSGATPTLSSNLQKRFLYHRDHKRHQYGMVLGRTSLEASLQYEKWGTVLLEKLKDKDGLCIANKTLMALGNKGGHEPGILYMTFTIEHLNEKAARILNISEIKGAVDEILKETTKEDRFSSDKQIKAMKEAGLIGLSRANDKDFVGQCVVGEQTT